MVLSRAERFSRLLAQKGLCIVSGMARGIDAAAHRGAIIPTGAPLPCLVAAWGVIYPGKYRTGRTNPSTWRHRLRTSHEHTTRFSQFSPRNRLISGLSLGVLVIESSLNSGSLITAQWALEQGERVFAIPGNIDTIYSRGTHKLIKEGAKLVEDIADIIQGLGPAAEFLNTCDTPSSNDPRSLLLNSQEKDIRTPIQQSERH